MTTIIPYRNKWVDEFNGIGKKIREQMGNLALRIDHIGSTSVPGLAAKDKIDIQVTVLELSEAVAEALESTGFRRNVEVATDHLPPGSEMEPEKWVKWYFQEGEGMRPIHVHVRIAGYPNQRYPLLFRDYLRVHSAAVEAYARVKVQLSHYHAEEIEAYCDIKDPVCDLILQAAEAWAKETGWQPGPSDC